MSTAQSRKIVLRGSPRQDEAVASGVIKPGHLIKLDSNDKVLVHATANGEAERAFAVEDALQGRTIDTAYAIGERVSYVLPVPGDEVAAYIKAGANGNIVIGDKLVSAGNGCLEKYNGTVLQVIAIAREAVDLNDSGDVDTRIRVRIV